MFFLAFSYAFPSEQNTVSSTCGLLNFFLFSPTNFRFMSLKVLCTWREWKNRQTGNSSHTWCLDVNSLPFPTLMFVLCCKCISFNSTAYILSFLICEATSLCLAYGLYFSKELFFVLSDVAAVCFFWMGRLSLTVSLTSQIYSSLQTSKAATWQYFKKNLHILRK